MAADDMMTPRDFLLRLNKFLGREIEPRSFDDEVAFDAYIRGASVTEAADDIERANVIRRMTGIR